MPAAAPSHPCWRCRGADPLTQVDRRADVPTARSTVPGDPRARQRSLRPVAAAAGGRPTGGACRHGARQLGLPEDHAAAGRLLAGLHSVPAAGGHHAGRLVPGAGRPAGRASAPAAHRAQPGRGCRAGLCADAVCQARPLRLIWSKGGAVGCAGRQGARSWSAPVSAMLLLSAAGGLPKRCACGCRRSPVAKRLHAVAVFGAPQPGDAEFAELLRSRLPGGCVRCQHAADMVCPAIALVPPRSAQARSCLAASMTCCAGLRQGGLPAGSTTQSCTSTA